MHRYIKPLRFEPAREANAMLNRRLNIEHLFAGITIKVAMLAHIRAKARRAPLHVDLAHQPAMHQRIQAIINRGHGNFRPLFSSANKNILGGGMVTPLQQNFIHALALLGETKASISQSFAKTFGGSFGFDLSLTVH